MMFKYLKFKSLKFKRLNPKPLNVKLILVIGVAVLSAFLYFLFFHNPIQDIPYDIEYLGLKVEPLVFEGRRVHFPYTDDNNGESIIIKSDKKIYEGGDRSDVYFTLTNTSDKSEKVAILSYFPKEYGDINYVDVWNGEKWQDMPITRGNIKGNMTKLGKAFAKKKPVPDRFDVKAGIQFEISAGHTAYFKAEITYPFDKEGEFWFEAFGDQGGYGLLDPIFVGQTTTSKDTPPGWYSGSWSYRKRITIDKKKVSGTSDLSSFPVLVSRTDSDFKHTSFGGNVASSSAGPTGGGGDFVFTSLDGTTKLDHEIEKYASSSGEIIAWVEVPTLSVSADTVLYVYYGGPSTGATNQNVTGTWDVNFVGVWHLKERDIDAGSGDIKDSTSNANNGTTSGMDTTDQVSGKINGSMDFDGTNDYVDLGDPSSLIPGNFITISGWIRLDTRSVIMYLVGQDSSTSNNETLLRYETTGDMKCTVGGSALTATSVDILTNQWYHLGCTYDGSNIRVYLDGSEVATTTKTGAIADEGNFNWNIGRRATSASYLDGLIDDVRISNTARSSDWIKTEYDNQSKPSTFYGFGGQQSRTSATTKIGQTTTSRDTTPGWYSGSWSYRKRITIDKKKVSGTSDLSSFPVLVSRTDPDFKHTSFGGNVASSSAGATGGGGDFVFTSSDGTTKIDHEIEKYASSSGEIIAWVEVPTLSVSADTVLYVYYGGPSSGATNQNKTGVWDNNYIGVWHMKEDPTTTCSGTSEVCDSTSNNNHADSNSMEAGDQVAGKIGGSLDFDGVAEYLSTSDIAAIDSATNLTGCAWVNQNISDNDETIFSKDNATTDGVTFYRENVGFARNDNYSVFVAESGGTTNGTVESTANASTIGVWTHVCFTATTNSSTGLTMYINGAQDFSATSANVDDFGSGTNVFNIGVKSNGTTNEFNGRIDEVRVSNSVRSADWIKTEYDNQFKPSTFYGFGGQQKITSATTKIGQTTTSKDTTPGWYSGSWTYRKRITIDKKKVSGTSDLSSFPVLVSRTDPDFKHTSFGGNVASSSAGPTGGGGDFVFTSLDGTTKLDHEIEKYASSSGEIIAWVEVPTLAVATDTVLYVYYGGPSTGATNQNKTGTWDSNYVGVWHLPNGTTLEALDSTSNANNGTITETVAGAGKVDGAGSFDGTNDLINVGSATSLDNISQGTVTMWIKPTSVATFNKSLYLKRDGTNNFVFGIADTNAGDLVLRYNRTGGTGNLVALTNSNYITINEWQFVAGVWNASGVNGDQRLYRGTSSGFAEASYSTQTVNSGTHDDSTVSGTIGARADGTGPYAGIIDEVRVSNTPRSSDWIKTEYTNQSKPSTFYGFGGQQKRN